MSPRRARQQAQHALLQLGALRHEADHLKALADYGFGPVDIEAGMVLCLRAIRACDALADWQHWHAQFTDVQRACFSTRRLE